MSRKWLVLAAVFAALAVALVGVERVASWYSHSDVPVAASPATEPAPASAPEMSDTHALTDPTLTR